MPSSFSGKTFDHQKSLPKLPVPRLDETCDRFLEWVQPLLTDAEFDSTRKIVANFRKPEGDGEKLQAELLRWSRQNDLPNWLEPFWDRKYLASRTPLPINVNFCTVCDDHPSGKAWSQVKRAAMLIHLTLRFKLLIDDETLGVDTDRNGPLCMVQFKKLFSTTRIPEKNVDRLRCPISPKDPTSAAERHIVVLYNGHLFSLDVLAPSGASVAIGEIESALEHILAVGAEKVSDDQTVAVLTTMNRDDWAEAREALMEIDPRNRTLLDTIDSALFALCLDVDSPVTLDERFGAVLSGSGRDRWFDKSFQFIVGKNGAFGVNGEHAGLDGYPVHRLIRFIYDESASLQSWEKHEGTPADSRCRRLQFYLDEPMRRIISKATDDFQHAINNTSTSVLTFDAFGKARIKSFHISPDAFVQLALQVAMVKLFGRCRSIYEVASTRRFRNGRTETLRSVSSESRRFVEDMLSAGCDDQRKVLSLQKAAGKHVARMRQCMAGRGVERHLFGLLSMSEQVGADIDISTKPEIFDDIGWQTLRHDTLSTTSNPDPHGVVLSGFGPVVADGFGICYTTTDNRITVTVTSRSQRKEAMEQFVQDLQRALADMAALLGQ